MRPRLFAAALLFAGCSSDWSWSDWNWFGGPGPADGPHLVADPIDLPEEYDAVTAMAFFPAGDDFLLLGKKGEIWQLSMDGDAVTEKGRMRIEGTHTDTDCGLVSVVFDPEFASNNFFYVGRCVSASHSTIERYTWNADDVASVPASKAEIIRVGDKAASKPWHNVGAIGFDRAGVMWALFGDKKQRKHGQDTSNNLGALIRIHPNRKPGGSGYKPVKDRPFANSDVYAYGLRSPWTGLIDDRGFYWVGDVGADAWEEVDLVTEPGQNFGWSTFEGPCPGGCKDTVAPLMVFKHGVDQYVADDPEALPAHARVVLVGVAYRDNGNDRYGGMFNGRTLVGELCTGFSRLVEVNEAGEKVLDQHIGHVPHAHAWTQAPDGWIYAVRNGGCGAGSIEKKPAVLQRLRLEQ